jgi:class 3 adenylate cyclase
MQPGQTKYTTVDGSMVAYQVTGDGPVDVVYMLGIGSNFEHWWEYPPFARMLERMSTFGRLILFDRRGSGISDALPPEGVSTWESYADDLRAVLDASGSEEAVIMAAFDGGPVAMTFAATNPARVRGLILWNSYARGSVDDDYPIGRPVANEREMSEMLVNVWGTEGLSRFLLGDNAEDPQLLHWHGKLMRGACTPASYARQHAEMSVADARSALPLIVAPVLVLHAADYPVVEAKLGRYVADHVQNGRYHEVPGASLDIFTRPDADEIIDMIEEFCTGMKPSARADRVLSSVLFTDIVASTERAADLGDHRWRQLLEAHDGTASELVRSWRGEVVKTTGDGLLATFDGPGRALRCAIELIPALHRHNLAIRSGVHFGEIERRSGGDVGGIGVHIAARTMALAGPGEIVCTRTVKELALGAGIDFDDRGTHTLKGVPDEWQLFAVRP